ncbi:hypothetical protein NCC49_005288 [Naganishia albida]|nr:hypothetical protein NCC49_005288 [Naganishia albida]
MYPSHHACRWVKAIGFSRDLDVYPDFEKYIAAFETFGNLVLGVLNAGGAELLHAIDPQGMEALLKDGDRKAQDMIKEDMELLDEETREKDNIQDEMNDTSKKMAQTRLQIVAVEEEMRHHDITIGDIFRVAGNSLILPELSSRSYGEIVQDGPEIVKELFKSGEDEIQKKIKESLSNVIETLVKGKSPDNSRSVAPVQRRLEVAHQMRLQQRQAQLAGMRCDSLNASIDPGKASSLETRRMINTVNSSATTLQQGALEVIRAAQLKIDHVQASAYRALRAAEIYTLGRISQTLPRRRVRSSRYRGRRRRSLARWDEELQPPSFRH